MMNVIPVTKNHTYTGMYVHSKRCLKNTKRCLDKNKSNKAHRSEGVNCDASNKTY